MTIQIDLDKLKPYCNLIPDEHIELELVKLFRLYYFEENSEPVIKFTQIVLNKLFNHEKERNYDDITNFYKEEVYLTQVFSFLSRIEIMLLSKIKKPIINNIVFDKIEDNIAFFKVT